MHDTTLATFAGANPSTQSIAPGATERWILGVEIGSVGFTAVLWLLGRVRFAAIPE